MSAASMSAAVAANGYGRRWHEHNAQRQRLILDTALELLDDMPAGVEPTVRDVASRCGLAKSVVYRQFEGREDLYARMRTHLTDQFAESLYAKLDLSNGSAADVLRRTISATADFMASHPRWIDLARSGPRHDDPTDVDALTGLKRRIAHRAKQLLDEIALSVGVDPVAFASISYAVVSMVEGVLVESLRGPVPQRPFDEVVGDLSAYSWFMLDGAARAVGLEVDPTAEVTTVLSRLAGRAGARGQAG